MILGRHTLTVGDCVAGMAALPDCSVDSVVTDPPYLIGFMAKEWDKAEDPIAWHRRWMREALRVLKPGGHLVAFSATRADHWLKCAAEAEGFELRDTINWCYWSGFPKSLDVSKAIDRRRDYRRPDVERVVRWFEAARVAAGVSRRAVEERFGTINIGQAIFTITPGSTPRVPTLEQVPILLELFGGPEPPEEIAALIWDLNAAKGQPGPNWWRREVVGSQGPPPGLVGMRFGEGGDITAPHTPDAIRWQGWGTALKPAVEPALLARKPLSGTVAATVLEHGTGAINVDACRFAYGDPMWPGPVGDITGAADRANGTPRRTDNTKYGTANPEINAASSAGRFPANLVYCPKPSTAEREAGCEGLRQQSAGELTGGRAEGSDGLNSPRAGAGRGAGGRGNTHPTVKPLRLMRWLVRLVTPPGGVVLEPFCGSGTTLLAAECEGFDCIAFERTEEYAPIIAARFGAVERLRLMSDGAPSDARAVEVAEKQGTLL